MAESSDDGVAPLTLSIEKCKREGEHGEGEDQPKGLVNPLTSAYPDLDISTCSFKCTQPSNPANKNDDHGDYGERATPWSPFQKTEGIDMGRQMTCGGRATTEQRSFLHEFSRCRRKSVNRRLIPFLHMDSNEEGSKSNSKPKLGGPEVEDLQVEKDPSFVFPVQAALDLHKEGSKSSSKLPKGEDLQVEKFSTFGFPDPHKEGSKSSFKPYYPFSDFLPFLETPREYPFFLLRKEDSKSGSIPKPGGPEGEDWQGLAATRVSPRMQKKLKLGEPEGENLQGNKDPSLCFLFSTDVRVRSPEAQYRDVDEDDTQCHDKCLDKIRRGWKPPKYKVVGVEEKHKELWERYLKQIEESEGYDITEWPGITCVTPIYPQDFKKCSSYAKIMSQFADAAIKKFNSTGKEEDDQYEVHNFLTVNQGWGGGCRCYVYYITFEAKKKNSIVSAAEDDHEGAPLLTTFQARVFEDFATGEVEVQECRIKVFKPSPA